MIVTNSRRFRPTRMRNSADTAGIEFWKYIWISSTLFKFSETELSTSLLPTMSGLAEDRHIKLLGTSIGILDVICDSLFVVPLSADATQLSKRIWETAQVCNTMSTNTKRRFRAFDQISFGHVGNDKWSRRTFKGVSKSSGGHGCHDHARSTWFRV